MRKEKESDGLPVTIRSPCGICVGSGLLSMQSIRMNGRIPLLTNSSSWYQIYFAAVIESDPKKALSQMTIAQKAIQDRMLELRKAPPKSSCEFEDLKSALNYLDILAENMDRTQSGNQIQWE